MKDLELIAIWHRLTEAQYAVLAAIKLRRDNPDADLGEQLLDAVEATNQATDELEKILSTLRILPPSPP